MESHRRPWSKSSARRWLCQRRITSTTRVAELTGVRASARGYQRRDGGSHPTPDSDSRPPDDAVCGDGDLASTSRRSADSTSECAQARAGEFGFCSLRSPGTSSKCYRHLPIESLRSVHSRPVHAWVLVDCASPCVPAIAEFDPRPLTFGALGVCSVLARVSRSRVLRVACNARIVDVSSRHRRCDFRGFQCMPCLRCSSCSCSSVP